MTVAYQWSKPQMLKWPMRAQSALMKLFRTLQDIDIFVEDKDDEPFYRTLLEYALQGRIPIVRVFGLGGRSAVLAHASSHDLAERRALFIIDGDLEWVRGEPPPHLPAVHRHDAYCIENLLLCETAVSKVLSEEAAVAADEAQLRLAYGKWLTSVSDQLVVLFAAYSLINSVNPSVKTVAGGVGRLCSESGRRTILDTVKVEAEIRRVLDAASVVVGEAVAKTELERIADHLRSLPDPHRAVSGKTFLLPLLGFHLQTMDCRVRHKSLRMRLSTSGDPTRFSALANAVTSAAR